MIDDLYHVLAQERFARRPSWSLDKPKGIHARHEASRIWVERDDDETIRRRQQAIEAEVGRHERRQGVA